MKYVETDGRVYIEITGAIYGLSQSGCIANQDIQKHLAKYGYYPTKRKPGLWDYWTRPISFTLVVDNFIIKYTNKDDIDDLFKATKYKYQLKIDWTGAKYVGINLDGTTKNKK